ICFKKRFKICRYNTAIKNNTSIIFGSPIKGLDEILSNSSFPLKISDLSDYVINTIPNQGTETVRTEEAIFATLAQLNLERIKKI
ncbi:MAG: putative RNA uridine N3 methyltransferase, partial [Methanosarcinales archaeon]